MEEHFKRINEISDKLKDATTEEEKELLTREFWLLAVDAFNEHIAGPIVTADGRILYTPPIEL